MKVDFILLGASKSGTTTMADILRDHPDINFCKKKEPNFFSRTKNWKNNVEQYHKLFDEEEGKIYGEASHTYTALPKYNLKIWEDIYTYNPEMKFIYIVRNPIDRFISGYMQAYQRGRINMSIDDVLHRGTSITKSRYYTQITPFIERFGKEKILIINFDDFISKRKEVMMKISDFLCVNFNKFKNFENLHSNVSIKGKKLHYKYDKYLHFLKPVLNKTNPKLKDSIRMILTPKRRLFLEKPTLTPEQQQTIIRLTKLDTIELSKLTGMDYSDWLKVKN